MTIYSVALILANGQGGGLGWWIPLVVVGMILFCVLMMGGRRRMMCMHGDHEVGSGEEEKTSAVEVLERRLAEGDLTVEEYRERRDLLAGRPDAES
jgi:uncharacterized membrane protein